ncbi:hypothetical protein SUGI_1109050 [Cryptomeria japonica]|nr:hypothetical protein SUGI_1109050 [Cryptomeria japonica]
MSVLTLPSFVANVWIWVGHRVEVIHIVQWSVYTSVKKEDDVFCWKACLSSVGRFSGNLGEPPFSSGQVKRLLWIK